jgi:hypothetical protein
MVPSHAQTMYFFLIWQFLTCLYQAITTSSSSSNKMVSFGGVMDIVSKVLEVGSHLVTVVEKVASLAKSWVWGDEGTYGITPRDTDSKSLHETHRW